MIVQRPAIEYPQEHFIMLPTKYCRRWFRHANRWLDSLRRLCLRPDGHIHNGWNRDGYHFAVLTFGTPQPFVVSAMSPILRLTFVNGTFDNAGYSGPSQIPGTHC